MVRTYSIWCLFKLSKVCKDTCACTNTQFSIYSTFHYSFNILGILRAAKGVNVLAKGIKHGPHLTANIQEEELLLRIFLRREEEKTADLLSLWACCKVALRIKFWLLGFTEYMSLWVHYKMYEHNDLSTYPWCFVSFL